MNHAIFIVTNIEFLNEPKNVILVNNTCTIYIYSIYNVYNIYIKIYIRQQTYFNKN